MGTFDQAKWRDETTWSGKLPTPAEVWSIVHALDVDPWFRKQVAKRAPDSKLLRAALVQSLVRPGDSAADVRARFKAETGINAREITIKTRLGAKVQRRARWHNNFANLVSGRFTELLFESAFSKRLAEVGLDLFEETADRSFSDFRISSHDPSESTFVVRINVKNAGVQMRSAEQFFGLTPEDTIPMATYKAFGAAKAGPPLLYVFLVDWGLLERLREGYWTKILTAGERDVFRLMTSFTGFPRNLEDDFINATIRDRFLELSELVGYKSGATRPFHTISAAKCHSIFYEQHERSPYVYVKRMETDPNVHISVKAETVYFGDVITEHMSSKAKRATLLKGLGRTKPMAIPDPPL